MDDFLAFSSKAEDQQDEAGPAVERAAPALVTTTPPPWLIYNPTQYDLYAPPLIRLHNEILTCCEYIAPTMSELKHRDIVLNEIASIISLLWPQSKVHVFGSQMTKILTPTSDLDIAVLNVVDDKMDQSQLLYQLADKLKDSGLVSYVEAIVHAKVPIVKCDHRRSQLSVDICINNDSGIRTGQLIRKFVREYPPLRPLVLILKVFLTQRRLNDTYSGGIGSFLLTLMIVSFLQMKRRLSMSAVASCPPSWNLGTLLLEFLQLYGSSFNYFATGITINDHGRYLKKAELVRREKSRDSGGNNARPNLLYLLNPEDSDLDVGRSSFMMPKIKRSFEHAHQVLTAALVDRHVTSYLAYIIRTDDAALQDRPGPELRSKRSNADAL